MNEYPWFDVRFGFMARDMQEVEDWMDRVMELLPFPGDVIATYKHSESLSAGEGFGD